MFFLFYIFKSKVMNKEMYDMYFCHLSTFYFKGKISNSLMIKMGVPQGSILDPLLFSIYVNSMPNCTSNGIIDMYADDTTLSVSGTTGSEVEQKLTIALHELMTWITKNRLVLNSDKTCVMVIGSRAYLKKIESFNVFINATFVK